MVNTKETQVLAVVHGLEESFAEAPHVVARVMRDALAAREEREEPLKAVNVALKRLEDVVKRTRARLNPRA